MNQNAENFYENIYLMKKLIILFLLATTIFTNCLPIKSIRKEDAYHQTMLRGYEKNRKAKVKTRMVYDINDKGKIITQKTNFDTLGRVITEERYNWSQNFEYKDTTFLKYEYDGFFLKKISTVGDERNPSTTYFTFDKNGYLVKIVHDNLQPVTYLLNQKNTNKKYYEMIGMVGYRDEIPKNVDWSEITKYTNRFYKNGLPFLFKIEEEGVENLRIETTYDEKLRVQSYKDFYYNRLTSESTFEYDKHDLITKEIIKITPFEQQEDEVYSPVEKPEMRVFEYEYFE